MAKRIQSDIEATFVAIQKNFHELLTVSKTSQSQMHAVIVNEMSLMTELQDVSRQQIEHAVEALRTIDGHNEALSSYLQDLADDSADVPRFRPLLENMYGTYMMERQRSTHDDVTLGRLPSGEVTSGPLIELF